jgi:phosphoribosylglycinamide formyltransferase 2
MLPVKILLLGSGELAKEFVISAKRIGCYVVAVDSYSGAPAHQVSDEFETLDMLNEKALRSVVYKHNPNIIVPEIEAIRTELLVEFEQQGIQVVPSGRAVNYTMNRDHIRNLASRDLGIKTAEFDYAESAQESREIASRMGYPVVVKPVMSSSGKGQSVVYEASEMGKGWDYACSGMRGDRERVIIEKFIDFDYEITLLTVRQKDEDTLYCQPIGHRQENGDYRESWQPAPMDASLLKQAQYIAEQITSNLGGYGIFGVEFFVRKGEVIFSELSPRPHDTGMVTLVSQNLNEFDLHLRAVLGLPIPAIEFYGPSASAVVLADRYSESLSYTGISEALSVSGVDVMLFGKLASRPLRRMGVCLARADTIERARQNAYNASQSIDIVYH